MEWLKKLLLGDYSPAVRRRHLRSLGVALVLGFLLCLIVAGIIYLLYVQKRI